MSSKTSIFHLIISIFDCYTTLIQDFDVIVVPWNVHATIQFSFLLKMRRMKRLFTFVSSSFSHFIFHATLQQIFCVNSGSMKESYDVYSLFLIEDWSYEQNPEYNSPNYFHF